MWYVVSYAVSDGNDCTVYDSIAEADSAEAAGARVENMIESDEDGSLEPDGNMLGYFFTGEEGGISHRETQGPFASFADADDACDKYHCRADVD